MESFRFQQPIILSRFHQNGTECTDYRKCRVDDGILDRTNLADV